MRSTRTIVGLLALRAIAWCQAPVISGVANSASYQPTLPADGAIVSIFGTNLADTTAVAQSVPLPLELAGTSVKMGGAAAPLFYVSPTQINLQIPKNSSGSFVVYTPAGSSAPYDPYMANPKASYAGGIFSANGSGCSQGAVLNAAADGSVSVNSSADSAAPGDYISIFGTGL
jgi:uncharacterized protein (TIGR03437 family)